MALKNAPITLIKDYDAANVLFRRLKCGYYDIAPKTARELYNMGETVCMLDKYFNIKEVTIGDKHVVDDEDLLFHHKHDALFYTRVTFKMLINPRKGDKLTDNSVEKFVALKKQTHAR
jgi:hypothetical protein